MNNSKLLRGFSQRMTTRAVIDAQASCGVETGFEVEKRLTSMITKREKTLQFVNKISRPLKRN